MRWCQVTELFRLAWADRAAMGALLIELATPR